MVIKTQYRKTAAALLRYELPSQKATADLTCQKATVREQRTKKIIRSANWGLQVLCGFRHHTPAIMEFSNSWENEDETISDIFFMARPKVEYYTTSNNVDISNVLATKRQTQKSVSSASSSYAIIITSWDLLLETAFNSHQKKTPLPLTVPKWRLGEDTGKALPLPDLKMYRGHSPAQAAWVGDMAPGRRKQLSARNGSPFLPHTMEGRKALPSPNRPGPLEMDTG